ncbi:MAG: hypothetical protein ACI8Z1_002845 [Candidatus Azotimanducaceae bacterium]
MNDESTIGMRFAKTDFGRIFLPTFPPKGLGPATDAPFDMESK